MTDEIFMRRALDLAKLGSGSAAPNPMVGCVITHKNKIIGEGYHQQYGQPHAEVNAINAVDDHTLLKEASAYVTLEPCSHFGKTPPCADLLVEKGIKSVIICNVDPNPRVAGNGIKRLENAGIDVKVGILENEGLALNKRFFTFQIKKRPYVVLKWAQTQDGFVARRNFDSKWISNPDSRRLVHKWRGEEMAIMVGKNTALHDNPSLNVRDWSGKNPIRIVLDSNLQLAENLKIFDNSIETIVLTNKKTDKKQSNTKYIPIENLSPKAILDSLHKENILSVFIEGGSQLLKSFVEDDLWDEAKVFVSDNSFDDGIKAPPLNVRPISISPIGENKLYFYQNHID